jgi:hypothetical protein
LFDFSALLYGKDTNDIGCWHLHLLCYGKIILRTVMALRYDSGDDDGGRKEGWLAYFLYGS